MTAEIIHEPKFSTTSARQAILSVLAWIKACAKWYLHLSKSMWVTLKPIMKVKKQELIYKWRWIKYGFRTIRLPWQKKNAVILMTGFDKKKFELVEIAETPPITASAYPDLSMLIYYPRIIVSICVLGAISLISVLTITILQPEVHTLDLTNPSFEVSSNLYLNELENDFKFGGIEQSSGLHAREILSSPLSIIWKPSSYPLDKHIQVSALLSDTASWDISFYCPSCATRQKYNWLPFFHGGLRDYQLVQESTLANIYTTAAVPNFVSNADIHEWLSTNATPGASVAVLDNCLDLGEYVNEDIDYLPNSQTVINEDLRGPHQFYVFLENSFSLDVIKEDLNRFQGSDEVGIQLLSLNGDIVYENNIPAASSNNEQAEPIVHRLFEYDALPYKGVYKLMFVGKGTVDNDWILRSIKVNTNKIVVAGSVLPTKPNTLYAEFTTHGAVNFYIWDQSYIQSVNYYSAADAASKQGVQLTQVDINNQHKVQLDAGNYNIDVEGNLYVSGTYFAFNKASYFLPFKFNFNVKLEDKPEFVVSKVHQQKQGEFNLATLVVDSAELLRLQRFDEISIVFRNTSLEQRFNASMLLKSDGYRFLTSYDGSELWTTESEFSASEAADNLTDFVSKNIPAGSSLYYSLIKQTLDKNSFIAKAPPEGFTMSQHLNTDLDFSLRGAHEFYLYVDNALSVQVSKQDLNWYLGNDAVAMTLFDMAGNVVCNTVAPDDGNSTNNNKASAVTHLLQCIGLKPDVYVLSIKDYDAINAKNDFLISQIKTNTNKIVAKDKVINTEPVVLYTNNYFEKKLGFNYWIDGKDQIIYLLDDAGSSREVHLQTADLNKTVNAILEEGNQKIAASKGYVAISGSNLAFKPENWFNPFTIEFAQTPDQNSDFKLLSQPYSDHVYIKNITLNVR